MTGLKAIELESASGRAAELLGAVKSKLGVVPNMTRVMANSPAVLEGYLGLSAALGQGYLDAETRTQLALLTAQENECSYCLSVHSFLGGAAGLTAEQMVCSRNGEGTNARTTAALTFAKRVLATRGQIAASDMIAVRDAGFGDGEIAEILAHVALNVFTNYFNLAAGTEIDFPKVAVGEAA